MNAKKSSSRPHLTIASSRSCPPQQPTGRYAAKPILIEDQEEPQPEWRFPERRNSMRSAAPRSSWSEQPQPKW